MEKKKWLTLGIVGVIILVACALVYFYFAEWGIHGENTPVENPEGIISIDEVQ